MMLSVVYAVGNRYHITGNEEVFQTVMSKEDFEIFRNRKDIIVMNTKKAD